jgi:hypothetical protein
MKIEIITDTTDVTFPIIIKDDKGNVIYGQRSDGYFFEATYDDNYNLVTFKDSAGYSQTGNKLVTEEEYEAFVNNK